MRITHCGHACLLVEMGSTRILLDPGTYSPGFTSLTDLTTILVTHKHADHLDPERLPALLDANPRAQLIVEPETAEAYADASWASRAERVATGHQLSLPHAIVDVVGDWHAPNHDKIPPLHNVGYLIHATAQHLNHDEPRLFHPGDSYAEVPEQVDILALPLNAPWCRMRDTLDFLQAVSPRIVVPIHDALLSDTGRAAYLMHIRNFGPEGMEIRDLSDGTTLEL